jgi:hypothetical protein
MALHAATVGILIEKSKFEPEVALGVAEAMDLAMTHSQFVTVPILDARLHEIKTELRVLQNRVDAKLDAISFDTKFAALDVKFAAVEARFDSKIAALEARLDTKMAELETRLVRWVFLVMLGNVALTLAANALVNVFKSL